MLASRMSGSGAFGATWVMARRVFARLDGGGEGTFFRGTFTADDGASPPAAAAVAAPVAGVVVADGPGPAPPMPGSEEGGCVLSSCGWVEVLVGSKSSLAPPGRKESLAPNWDGS